jgi:hypothetical protein
MDKTTRQNKFLQRHLEIRNGVAPAWYHQHSAAACTKPNS